MMKKALGASRNRWFSWNQPPSWASSKMRAPISVPAPSNSRTVATIRELFGAGTLMGYRIFELAHEGGWFQENHLFLLAPSAFFIIGFLVWGIRAWKPEQNEQPDFKPMPLPSREKRP